MNKSLTIISLIFIVFHTVIAQGDPPIQFYLSPHIGGEWTLSAFENKGDKPPYVTNTTLDFSDKYGISFIADFKKKFSLELGYGWGNVGWGLNYKSQTDSARNEISGSSSANIIVRRLTLKFVKPVTFIKIKRRKENAITKLLNIPDNLKYWAVFDINLFGGLSGEYIPPTIDSGELGIGAFGGTDAVVLNYDRSYNAYGYGVYTGFSLQFYQLGKRRFELGFIYHKGLGKRVLVEWETNINGLEFPTFNSFTRGSMIAIYVAYPIQLFKIEKAHNKR